MERYYINYGTGAGNEYVDGYLEDAQRVADEGATYTQCSITIYAVNSNGDIDDNPICERTWWGVAYDGDESDVIDFGSFGHYGAWWEY